MLITSDLIIITNTCSRLTEKLFFSTAATINDGSADLHDSVIKICDSILKDDDEIPLDELVDDIEPKKKTEVNNVDEKPVENSVKGNESLTKSPMISHH